MLRVMHLADLHLGWNASWNELPFDRTQERDARLRKAIDWALDQGIDLVIIAGDLFETHTPPSGLVHDVKRQLARALEAGIAVVTLPGNHDEISYHNSVYREHASDWPGYLVQNPHFQHSCTLSAGGEPVHMYALAFTGGLTQTHPPLSEFTRGRQSGYHLALLHGSLDFDRGDRSLPIDLKSLLAAEFDYVALGHFHKHQRHGAEARPVVYAGMIEGKGFDDPGVGHYTVAHLARDGVTLQTPAAQARHVRTITFDTGSFQSESELIEALSSQISSDDMVRIKLRGAPEFRLDVESLCTRARGEAAYVEVVDESASLSDERLQRIALEPTIRGAFAERMLKRLSEAGEPEVRRLIRRAIVLGLAAFKGEQG